MPHTRSGRTALMGLFDTASVPVYVLDDERRMVYCNPACAAWIGATVDDLVGVQCDYHSQPDNDAHRQIGTGLCPPPEVFAGRSLGGIVVSPDGAGGWKRRRAQFVCLGSDPLEGVGVIAVLEKGDIAESELELDPYHSESAVLHERVRQYRQKARQLDHPGRLIGTSAAITRVRDQVAVAIHSRARVLVVGPAGCGHEQIARMIHYGNAGASAVSLVPLDCALLDAELLEATVSAFVRRWTQLERDQPSALLLLDVDQLAADAQRELVGFLTIGEFELRTIATARRSLVDLADQGQFRPDLAHALSTLVITLPRLAQRREDIPLLAQMFLEEVNAAGKRQMGGFAPEAMDQLCMYRWPGELDELISAVRSAHERSEGPLIRPAHLPERMSLAADALAHAPAPEEAIELDAFLRQIESELLTRALRRAKGNRARAARLLGISRARLLRRIAQLGLETA
jgi:DNA-binding NtrC family response regulator